MGRTSHGTRFRTRTVFRKAPRSRGLPPPNRLLESYNVGDKVDVIVEPAVQRGMPHRRFHGKTGSISGRRGIAYLVKLHDGGKEKLLILRPEHIRRHCE